MTDKIIKKTTNDEHKITTKISQDLFASSHNIYYTNVILLFV